MHSSRDKLLCLVIFYWYVNHFNTRWSEVRIIPPDVSQQTICTSALYLYRRIPILCLKNQPVSVDMSVNISYDITPCLGLKKFDTPWRSHQMKHFPRYWSSVRGIHRSPMDSPHKGQCREALIFALICAWTNGEANNQDSSDLRRHLSHYDIILMFAYPLYVCRQYKYIS